MKIKVFFTLILICNFLFGYSQVIDKKINLIIVIDNEIAVGSIFVTNLYITDEVNNKLKIPVNYYPGSLTLPYSDYEKLVNNARKVILRFDYYDYSGKQQQVYNYEFELNKEWLKEPFLIFNVFNIDKKQFRKYPPLSKTQNYTFSITSPNYTFIRIIAK